MALIPIRIDRAIRPPIGTPIRSDGHWSVQGLVGAWAFNEGGGGPVDSVKGLRASLAGATWNPDGLSVGAADQRATVAGSLFSPADDKWSIVIRCAKANNTNQGYVIAGSSAYNNNAALQLRSNVYLSFAGVYYSKTTWGSAAAIAQQGRHTWVVSRNGPGTYLQAYKDGASLGNSSSDTLVNNWSGFNSFMSGGGDLNTIVESTLFYYRQLSAAETQLISENPWQIYEPETVWIEVGGGGEAALFAGSVYGQSSASAQLSTAVVLAAAAQGSTTAQAALSIALELAAQVNGIGSAEGTLSTAIHLIGVAAGQCGVVGRLAEPVEILAQLRVMASDPLALTISVRDPLALRVTAQ